MLSELNRACKPDDYDTEQTLEHEHVHRAVLKAAHEAYMQHQHRIGAAPAPRHAVREPVRIGTTVSPGTAVQSLERRVSYACSSFGVSIPGNDSVEVPK